MDTGLLSFSVIDQPEELAGIRQEWQALLLQSDANPLFSSWELADIFWQVYARDQDRLRIVCVREGRQLLALFPFYLRRRHLMRVVPLRALHWLGTGGDTSPDYLGGIVHRQYGDQYDAWLAQALVMLRDQFDVADLRDMQRAVDVMVLQRAAAMPMLHAACRERTIMVAALTPDWDAYLARLSANRRQQIRRARRKVFEQEGMVLDRLCHADQLEEWFSELVRLHHKRWQQKGEGEHAFRTSHYNQFHRSFMGAMLEGNALRLWGLKKDGRLVAMLYCLSDGHTTFYYQGGFDTDYDELKPGMVLMSCAMEEAIREGCREFNMMKGDYDFKRSLAKETASTWNLLLVRAGLVGVLYQLRCILLPAVKRWLRDTAAPRR